MVVVVVVYSEFSVLLWSKALVLDLDQAEQNQLQLDLGCSQDVSNFLKFYL